MPDALAHLRVLELSRSVPGAYAAKCLADLGADTVKVELPDGDPVRTYPPFLGDQPGPLRSALFAFCNTNKRSVTVDYARPAGAGVVRALAAQADLLVEDQAPGALARLGLGFADLQAGNPRLVVLSITPFGQSGPRRDWKGGDLTTAATSIIAMTTPIKVGDANRVPPLRPGGRQMDFVSGMNGATAAMLALHLRHRTGAGSHVDLSMQEALTAYTRQDIARVSYDPDNTGGLSVTSGSRHGAPTTLWGLMPCKDGSFAFQASEVYQWAGLMHALGDPEWAARPEFQDPYDRSARWAEIDVLMRERTMQMTKAEIYAAGQANHCPVFPCYTTAEALDDAQIRSREYFVTVTRPETGPVTMPGPCVRHERTPVRYRRPWPAPGEHTDDVLGPLIGAERLAALRAEGVVA